MKPLRSKLPIGIAAIALAMAGLWLTWASDDERARRMIIAQAQEPTPSPVGQVSEIRATHRSGQTVVTWPEVTPPALPERPPVDLIERVRRAADGVRYRIDRAATPIRSLDGLKPIGEVAPASGWNVARRLHARSEGTSSFVRDGEPPVAPGTVL